MTKGNAMNIYLICKHRTFRDSWGHGVFREYLIVDALQNKTIANLCVKDLNSRSKKYWYSVKKMVVAI
ncbi:MAG: hypothetical protein ACOVKL_03740 [Polynucleobacter sp.]